MYDQLRKETAKYSANQAAETVQGLSPDDVKQMLNDNVRLIADACLINSLHSQFGKTILAEDEAAALDNALIAIRTAINPGPTLHYDNVRNGFVELFGQFLNKSEEFVPGTNVTFADLCDRISNVDSDVTTQVYSESKPEPEPEPEPEAVEPEEQPET